MTAALTTEQDQAIRDFRSKREASLRRGYGWLSLAGLCWLDEGRNAFGSDAANPVRLPERFPAKAGSFTLRNGQVNVTTAAGIKLRLNDDELTGASPALKVDTSGHPDFLYLGDLRLAIIERNGQLAVRIWDPQSPVLRDFDGCVWYKPDAHFRVQAAIEKYTQPKQVMIDDIVGIQRPASIDAALAFELDGASYRLDAERQEDGSYDIIFKDSTAGRDTYGAGRYLTTGVAEGEQVVVDFNVAYNPPCAFTSFATCPLPLPQNILPVSIEAGEKYKK